MANGVLGGRVCELIVGAVPPVGSFTPTQPNALKIVDLRMSFSIEKDDKPQPNRCEVSIYNLAPSSRQLLASKGVRMILSAGYQGGSFGVIYAGDARYVNHLKENGVDWRTKIQAGDAERSFRFAFASQSFQPGTAVGQVVQRLVKVLGVDPGNVNDVAGQLNDQHADGFVVHAPAGAALTEALRPYGYGWSVQDGRMQILKESDVTAGQAVLISQSTGLIGSPEFGTNEKAKGPATLKVKSMLNAAFRVGGSIEVRSRGKNGFFRVKKLKHQGDTFGGDWFTELEAIPI